MTSTTKTRTPEPPTQAASSSAEASRNTGKRAAKYGEAASRGSSAGALAVDAPRVGITLGNEKCMGNKKRMKQEKRVKACGEVEQCGDSEQCDDGRRNFTCGH